MFQRLFIMIATLALLGPGHLHAQGKSKDSKTDEEREARGTDSDFVRLTPLEGKIDPDTYVLGPWDELALFIKGADQDMKKLLVLPEGNIVLPNVGVIEAAGLTLTAFRVELKKVLSKFYRNVEIDCQLARPRQFAAYILGEVKNPRQVIMTAPFRVSQAIGQGGGITENGSLRRIEIRGDGGEVVRTVDMFLFLKRGDLEHNPALVEGQSVYVPPREKNVNIIGEVLLPGRYELVDGETVEDLISHAAGLGPVADPSHIMLEASDGATVAFPIEDASQYELHDADLVIIRDKEYYSGQFRDPVFVFGGGGRQGWINVEKEELLTDFLSRLWRFSPNFDIEEVVLERDAPGDEHPLHVEFNVRAVLTGGEHSDMMVKPGDRIGFPPLEQKVYVAGEVNKPGELDFQPGASADRYIALSGGPNERGSFDRLTVYSAEGGKRNGDRNTAIYRGDTILVNRKRSAVFGTVFIGITSLTSLILAVVAVTK